jgi:hypothetical protein
MAGDPPNGHNGASTSIRHDSDAGDDGDDDLGEAGESEFDLQAEEDATVLAEPPQAVKELAAAAMRFVQGKYGITLDFTSDTLSLLDQYVRDARAEVLLLPSSLDLIANAVGCYWGEVLRRTFGGEWEARGDHSTFRLYFSKVYLSLNPVAVGREALMMQEEEGWGAHLELEPKDREMVKARLDFLPEASEPEFYLPTTRFDVIEVAFEALRGRMVARGDAGVRYIMRDYGVR